MTTTIGEQEMHDIAAGADPERVKIVDIDEIFLSYLPSNAAKVRIKAAGPLKE